jgi:hypothetical protein
MKMDVVDVNFEPKNGLYYSLIDAATFFTKSFILVQRHEVSMSNNGNELLNRLEPFLVTKEERQEWPGTKLLDGFATVYEFSLNLETAEILKRSVHSIFDWEAPERLEDLSFLREDKTPWFITISHEKDAYFKATEQEMKQLIEKFPQLEELFLRPTQTK